MASRSGGSGPTGLAAELADAQVAWVLGRLQGEQLADQLAQVVDDLLAVGEQVPLGDLVDSRAVKAVLRRVLDTVPASVAANEAVGAATDVLLAGPAQPFPVRELADPEQVEALLDELLGHADLVEQALERLTASPLTGVVATRFMGRIVGEVLATNQALANKVPGLGRMVSLGTSAAGVVKGAADKQLSGLLGDTAGKGAAFAVRPLNRILVETLRDPTTRDALLQVWGLLSEEEVQGLARLLSAEDATRIADTLQGILATAAATGHVGGLVDAFVDAFLTRYATHPPTVLLDDLGLTRDDLVADLQAIAPRAIDAALASGELERAVRGRIEPFFASPEVVALLDRG